MVEARRAAERDAAGRRAGWYLLAYGALIVAGLVALVPFLYVISLSLKHTESLVDLSAAVDPQPAVLRQLRPDAHPGAVPALVPEHAVRRRRGDARSSC